MQEYNELIKWTKELVNLKPWKWMPDDLVFVVEDPITGENFYCLFLGYNKIDYGFNAYKGQNGLISLIDMFNKDENYDIFPEIDMLSIGFVKESFLMNYDIDILEKYNLGEFKDLGFSQFATKKKGCPYSKMSDNDIRQLTLVLKKGIEFAIKYRNNMIYLLREDNKLYQIYLDKNEWKEKLYIPNIKYRKLKLNELSAMRVKKKASRIGDVWDMGTIYLPELSVDEETESYFFPKVLVVIDYFSGEILASIMYNSDQNDSLKLSLKFLEKLMITEKSIPSKITFNGELLYYGLEEFCKALRIETSLNKNSENIIAFREDIGTEIFLESFEEDLIFDFMIDEVILEVEKMIERGEIDKKDVDDDFIKNILDNFDDDKNN